MTVEFLPLRGRQDELAVIEDRLREVSAGTGGAIVIEGSAGVGKTKLIDASMQLARDLGFRAGRGVLEPYRTGPTELEALFDALFEGPSPLADRRALDDSHASPEFMFWLIQDLQSVIEEAALQSPILICLDDLHWAGASCAVAIRQLGPRLASLPVAWIVAFRPNQGLAPVQEAKSDLVDGGAAHINLGPLKREAVALVAADVERLARTVNERFAAIDAREEADAARRLHVGARVRLGHNLRPLYLHGRPATIVERAGEKWTVRLDEPVGRFTNADLRLYARQLEPW